MFLRWWAKLLHNFLSFRSFFFLFSFGCIETLSNRSETRLQVIWREPLACAEVGVWEGDASYALLTICVWCPLLPPPPPAAAPAQLSEHGGGRRGSGASKGHIPDRRIHTLIKNSAAGSEPAGGWCIKPPKANYSSSFPLFLFVMWNSNNVHMYIVSFVLLPVLCQTWITVPNSRVKKLVQSERILKGKTNSPMWSFEVYFL